MSNAMKKYDDQGNEIVVDEKTEKERQAAFQELSKKAILVKLTRRQFQNLPYDIALSEYVATTCKMENNDWIQIRKFLIDPQHLAKIRSYINESILMVWNHTRPWENVSYRLLPMEYYDDFNDSFTALKDKFEEAVQNFIDNYDEYKKEAKKSLGKAFDRKQYPAKDKLKDLFALEIETTELPDIDDIRLSLAGGDLMRMKEEAAGAYTDATTEAIKKLNNMAVMNNVDTKNIVEVIKTLNVSNDPEVDVILAELDADIDDDDTEESMMVMDDFENNVDGDDDGDDEFLDIL